MWSVCGLLVLALGASGESAPSWVALCGKGYLFSDYTETWDEAGADCELYGGYLVRIESRHENNCIMRHAVQEDLKHAYWWTSGSRLENIHTQFTSIIENSAQIFLGNNLETRGVWTFENGDDMDWMAGWGHDDPNNMFGTSAITISFNADPRAGLWFDASTTTKLNFICEKEKV